MENIEICTALDDAIRIIIKARGPLSSGSTAIWTLLLHAENHLDSQIKEILKPVEVVND